MTVYNYKNIFINLLIIILVLMKNVLAQDDTNDIYNQPQNLVPNLDIKEEVKVQDNNSNRDKVVITELPKANLGWIGYLSDKDLITRNDVMYKE